MPVAFLMHETKRQDVPEIPFANEKQNVKGLTKQVPIETRMKKMPFVYSISSFSIDLYFSTLTCLSTIYICCQYFRRWFK